MNELFFKRVAKVVAERDGIAGTDKAKTEEMLSTIEQKVAQYEEELSAARKKSSVIIHAASEEAEEHKHNAMTQAGSEIDANKNSAMEKVESERQSSIADLGSTIRDITSLMVAKVLDQDVNLDLSDEKIKKAFDKKKKDEKIGATV